MSNTGHLVFVYGTLKRGQPNHEKMTNPENGTATFVGEAKTVEKWPLVIATKFNIPFLLDKPGHGHHVVGEVYSVDDGMLKTLDILERHPECYRRRPIQLKYSHDSAANRVKLLANEGVVQECFGYLVENVNKALFDLPYEESFDSARHQYIPFAKRNMSMEDIRDYLENAIHEKQ